MTPLLRKILGMNWLIFATMLALAIFGVIAIESVTFIHPRMDSYWHKQMDWVVAGVVVFLIVSLIDYRWLVKWTALPIYLVSIIMLLLTLVMGHKVNGARSWLHLGPMNFQPAQLAVMSGILVLALFLSQYKNLHPMMRIIITGIISGTPMLLILMQPDLGEVIIWVPVLLALWYIGGIPHRYLISILLLIAAAIPIVIYFKLKPFQFARITAFIDPSLDPQGAGWAINQVLVGVGSGGWAGKGFHFPTQVNVPITAIHNDYIYAGIAEQWGFLGGVVLISAYALLIITGIYIALRAPDDLGMLICVGVIALIFTHVYQNIGMNIAVMPVTGVPLPLISYSGSFVVAIMFGLGLVNSVWVHRRFLPDQPLR